MRTEEQVRAELNAQVAAYHEASTTETAPALRARSATIKALRQELNALLADGTDPCPRCQAKPLVHLKREIGKRRIYEVFCLDCPADAKPIHAHGPTAAAARMLWNAKEYS